LNDLTIIIIRIITFVFLSATGRTRLLLLALGLELQPERLGHGRWWWAGKPEGNLYRIVDEPLQRRQRTNHDNSRSKAGPAALPAQILENAASGGTGRLVEHGDDAIGGVRDDGAEHTGDVTGGEGDDELLALGALGAGLGHDVLVEELDGLLKARELHHGVGDLAEPEGLEALVEGVAALLGHLGVGFAHVVGVAGHGLNSDLHGFKWSQKDISKKLGGSRCSQVEWHSLGVGELFTNNSTVGKLEHLVEAKFTNTLGRVTDQGRCPTLGQTLGAIFSNGELEAIAEVLVLGGVDLESALDQIKWYDSGMRDTAREHTTKGA